MADDMKLARAQKVYADLCAAIDSRNWNYQMNDTDMVVCFGVRGDDIPVHLILAVDTERQLIRLLSPLPFKMSESKRVDGAIATCVASYGMADGSFDYDLSDGEIVFRMTASFRESAIGEALFLYMIDCSCAMVDQFNDKFLAVDKGIMSIEEFISSRA